MKSCCQVRNRSAYVHTQRTIYSYGSNCIGKQHSSFRALSCYDICFCFKLNIADYAALIKVCFVLSLILLAMLR
jgi:hypothetical protein